MTIRYKVSQVTLNGEVRPCPKQVAMASVSGREFQEKVARKAARGLAAVAAVLMAAREVLLEELREGRGVLLPGIGAISTSLKGELDEDQWLVVQNARLRVNLRPSPDLAHDLHHQLSFKYAGE